MCNPGHHKRGAGMSLPVFAVSVNRGKEPLPAQRVVKKQYRFVLFRTKWLSLPFIRTLTCRLAPPEGVAFRVLPVHNPSASN